MKRQRNCKGDKVSIHSGEESGCEKDSEAYEGNGVMEYGNIGVLGFERINPSFHYSNLVRPACNLAVRLNAIAICHKAHRHSERVARVANSSLPVNDDQTAGAAGFFCE